VQWLAQGAPVTADKTPSAEAGAQIRGFALGGLDSNSGAR